MPKLIWMHQDTVIGEHTLGDVAVRIGRAQDNEIRPDDPTVSRWHARVTWTHKSAVVEDLGSRNGTRVNGAPIEKQTLRSGDVIEIGQQRIRYAGDEPARGDETMVLRPEGPSEAVAQRRPASIRVLTGTEVGKIVKLEKPFTPVGALRHRVVVIARRREDYAVLGFGSGAGVVIVSGQPVSSGTHVLQDRDIIEIADTRLEFILGAP